MTNWAAALDVQQLTGKVVGDDDVLQAQAVVELLGGALVTAAGASVLSTRNLDWLRRAVAYQAAFMVEYPDYFTRMDVSVFTQDGTSATIKADGLVLAPLARRCIKRLSWRGMRTLHPSINRTNDRAGYRFSDAPDLPTTETAAYTSSAYDDDLPWQRL